MKKIIKFIFPVIDIDWENFDYTILYNNIFIEALKIWSLNLAFLVSYIIVSPLFITSFSKYPLFFELLFNMWFINGFKFHLVLYLLCIIIASEKQ